MPSESDKPAGNKPTGRPTVLTSELQLTLVTLLRAGNYIDVACRAAGLPRQTFYEWLRRGRDGEEPYATFHFQTMGAIAESEARDLETIRRASEVSWCAAAWRLERRFPSRWGRRERLEHSGPRGGAIATSVTVTLEDVDAALSTAKKNE